MSETCKRRKDKGANVTYRIIAIVLAFVLLGATASLAAGPFTGTWTAEIGLAPLQTMPFSSFKSTLDVGLHIGFVELSSSSDFILDGWLWQEFGLSAMLAFISFEGQMLFEPQSGSFLYAQGVLKFSFYPVVLSLYSAMIGPAVPGGPNYGYVVDLYGELIGGVASVESATFIGADLSGISFTQTASTTTSTLLTKTYITDPTIDSGQICFSGEELTFKATTFGCIDITAVTTFGKTGFTSQEIELSFLHLFNSPLNITLNYVFSLQTASHTFTPSLETDFGCLKVYTDLLGTGGQITGIEIYGIELSASYAGTTFRSISNLNTTDYVITTPAYGSIIELETDAIHNAHLYYSKDYWEIISLEVTTPGMGGTYTFSVDTFFGTSTGLLFDWGMTEMGVAISFGSTFSVSSHIVIDTTGFTAWKIGMSLSW